MKSILLSGILHHLHLVCRIYSLVSMIRLRFHPEQLSPYKEAFLVYFWVSFIFFKESKLWPEIEISSRYLLCETFVSSCSSVDTKHFYTVLFHVYDNFTLRTFLYATNYSLDYLLLYFALTLFPSITSFVITSTSKNGEVSKRIEVWKWGAWEL